MPHAQPLQPGDRVVEPVIFEVEPLTDAELGRVAVEVLKRELRRAILAQQTHVEMTVIARALGLFVPRRRGPRGRQVEQAVPVDARDAADEQFGSASETELL